MSYGTIIGEAIIRLIVAAFIAGAAIATLLIYAVPWAWSYIKPFIHMMTA